MSIKFLGPFLLSVCFSFLTALIVRRVALRFRVLDSPSGEHKERKIHTAPTPLLGGISLFVAFVVVVSLIMFFGVSSPLGTGYVQRGYIIGIFLAGLVLMAGGILDDVYRISAKKQIVFPLLAAFIVIASGIGVRSITNPLGGFLRLDTVEWNLFSWHGTPYVLTLFADLFTVLWLLFMMYTTKLLDGLDGLVAGISFIGAVLLFFVSLRPDLLQYDTALLALIFAGACLGFLVWNFHPARIFLGEGGSMFCGFMLGVLAIIAGGKITTALLVMGIPMLDLLWVVLRRAFFEKRSPFTTSDKKHLHFRLLDAGLSHRQAVLLLYVLAGSFGSLIFFIQGKQKLFALASLFGVMCILAFILVYKYNRDRNKIL